MTVRLKSNGFARRRCRLEESRFVRMLPGAPDTNRVEFTRQAAGFQESKVLGASEQITPVLEAARLQPEDRVLDVGCGTGFLLLPAARTARQVVGVDVTPAMLEAARRRLEEAGVTNVTLREANAEALPFAEDRFDAVLSRLTLHHCADPVRVLQEMHRVCRPGGRLALCDIITSDDPDQADLHNRLERLRDPSHVTYYQAEKLVRMVEEADFTVTGTRQWETERRFDEWVGLADVRPEVRPALRAFLEAVIDGDAAGLRAGRAPDGELTFVHRWLVVACVKP